MGTTGYGKKMTADELAEHQIIEKACQDQEDLMDSSLAFARSFQKKRGIMGEMKKRMYKHIIRIMEEEDPEYIESLQLMISD